jgi:hypothetical protein
VACKNHPVKVCLEEPPKNLTLQITICCNGDLYFPPLSPFPPHLPIPLPRRLAAARLLPIPLPRRLAAAAGGRVPVLATAALRRSLRRKLRNPPAPRCPAGAARRGRPRRRGARGSDGDGEVEYAIEAIKVRFLPPVSLSLGS